MFKKNGIRVNRAAILGATAVGALLLSATPAFAAEGPDQGQTARFEQSMSGLGIAESARPALVKKFETGTAIDAESDAAPVSVVRSIEDGYNVERSTFSDGSVSETGMEVSQEATPEQARAIITAAAPFLDPNYVGDHVVYPGIQTRATGISGCLSTGGGGVVYHSNCHTYYNGITASNSFDANYQQFQTGGSAAQYIDGTAKFVSVTQGVSNEQVRSVGGGSGIRYSFNTSLAGWGSIPGYLQLNTSSGDRWVTTG